ncbi:MAG: riboflavin synthase [Nannocystaceae bacterium]|nr:riboflavin synthase [Nannocystaceae bacterium]
MFTGLVQQLGTLLERRAGADQQTLVIEAALSQRDRVLGASVAIAGVCLTVTSATESAFEVQAAFETLSKTTLGAKSVGERLNLEPALRLGDALGGHLVSGHVDGVGLVRSIEARGDARHVWISVPPPLVPFIAEKGSVTVDGVSLTVNDVDDTGFSVGLIPHTLTATTLHGLADAAQVNLEVDLLARYVARLLDKGPSAGGRDGSQRQALTDGGWK